MAGGDLTGDRSSVELLTTPSEIEAARDDWRALAVARGSPFATPEWYLSWLAAYGESLEPVVARVRTDEGRTLGLLPFVAERGRRGAVLRPCRGDRFHPVAKVADEAAVAGAASRAVMGAGGRTRWVQLDNVDSESSWWRAFVAAAPGFRGVAHAEVELPYVDLAGVDWEGYLATHSRGFRSQLGRKGRALRREGDVRLRRVSSAEELDGALETLFRLHAARWRQRRDVSGFAKPDVRRFHERFARESLALDWLRLYTLELDETPIAAIYGWLIGGRWSYLQAGLDPAWSRYSPGFLLLAETIREAIEQGAHEFDLLLGDEAYKYRFASGSRRARSVVVIRHWDRGRVLLAAQGGARRAWRHLSPEARRRIKQAAHRVRSVRTQS